MGSYIASRVIKLMINRGIDVSRARVLMMGITFKENCPDLRNTKVIDIIHELHEYGIEVSIYDPWVNKEEAHEEYGVNIVSEPETNNYDGIVLAVAHNQFCSMSIDEIKRLCKDEHVIFDVKNILPANLTDGRL
jgi:UDP-N-acetyl-D-galactosamine dehydrogenase